MKFAICQEMFVDWPWERQCAFSAELGYRGLELAPFTLAPRITDVPWRQRQTMRKQAEDAGLEIIGLHWLLAKTEGLHLTTSDAAVEDLRASRHVRQAVSDEPPRAGLRNREAPAAAAAGGRSERGG